MQQTIAQFLKVKDFPFIIKDKNGNTIYWGDSHDLWYKQEFDSNGNLIYFENSDGYWYKREFDPNGNLIYFENSDGYWIKREYDSNGNEIYYEDSHGEIRDKRPKPSIELTLDEIANKLGINVSQLKIKK
jgi:hypothetical protein